MTRNEAIEIMRRTIQALAPAEIPPPFGPGDGFRFFSAGACAVVRSLIQAGAFDDGINWHDRLPVEPGESGEIALMEKIMSAPDPVPGKKGWIK